MKAGSNRTRYLSLSLCAFTISLAHTGFYLFTCDILYCSPHSVPGPKMSCPALFPLSYLAPVLLHPLSFSLSSVVLCLHAPLCKHTENPATTRTKTTENKGVSRTEIWNTLVHSVIRWFLLEIVDTI